MKTVLGAVADALIASLALVSGCRPTGKDPIATVRLFISLQHSGKSSAARQIYSLLSEEAKKNASLDDIAEYLKWDWKKNSGFIVVDSIAMVSGDRNLALQKRVRAVLRRRTEKSSVPFVVYYTTVRENGAWQVAWEAPLIKRVREMFEKGMHDEAIDLCGKAIAVNPYSAKAYSERCWCRTRSLPSGTYPLAEVLPIRRSAETDARKALSLEPEQHEFYNTLSNYYNFSGPQALGIECLRQALASPYCGEADSVRYYGNIANCFIVMNNERRAIAYCDSALAVDDSSENSCYVFLRRGDVQMVLERFRDARLSYGRALGLDWQNDLDAVLQRDLFQGAASCEHALRDDTTALRHVLKALELQPSDARSQELYGRIKDRLRE